MIWLSWRQQRLETAMTAGLLALVAAALVPLGLHMASVYSGTGVGACLAHTAENGRECSGIVDDFRQRFEHAGPIVPWLNFVPGLFGVLFAAPFVLDLEQGTFRLAWTQSVTRRRWLSTKLLTIYASGLVAAFVLTMLMTWWRQPLDRLGGRMEPNVFDFEGVVPYAYTVFALSLVIALGVFTRRTLVAAAGGLLAYFAARIVVQTWVRQDYVMPITRVWRPGTNGPNIDHAWTIISGPGDAHGHALPNAQNVVLRCMGASKGTTQHCLATRHIFNLAVYQPASRFWLFQGIEFAIFAGAGVALLAAAVWWLRHRIG